MLTSFFGKSNPVNYLIAGIFISLGYLLRAILLKDIEITFTIFAEHLLFLSLSVFTMLLLDFVIRKNLLTKSNTYGIFLFTCFLITLPAIFSERNITIATIFFLLAFRRILSLRSDRNTEKKILDASIWITLASFFSFWSLLFFAILYFAIIRKQNTLFRYLFIPIAGFIGVLVIRAAFHFLLNDSFDWFFEWGPLFDFNFSAYNKANVLVPVTVIVTFIIWTGIYRFSKIASLSKKEKPNALLLLFTLLITILIALISPQKNGSELLFVICPLAIIITNYIENISEFWFKEVLLWIVVLLPLVVLFL